MGKWRNKGKGDCPDPHSSSSCSTVNYRDADDVFLLNDDDAVVGGSDGPWTGADSASLSSPKLVMNSTTAGADVPGDLDLDRDDDILHHASIDCQPTTFPCSLLAARLHRGTLVKCSANSRIHTGKVWNVQRWTAFPHHYTNLLTCRHSNDNLRLFSFGKLMVLTCTFSLCCTVLLVL